MRRVCFQCVLVGITVCDVSVFYQRIEFDPLPVVAVNSFVGENPDEVLCVLPDGKYAPAAQAVLHVNVLENLGLQGKEARQKQAEQDNGFMHDGLIVSTKFRKNNGLSKDFI